MGVWNDSPSQCALLTSMAFGPFLYPQELFTRKVPFHECQGPGAIVYTILRALPTRPGEEETFFRLTDNWWEMCASCWNRQPFLRPQMSALVKSISPKARPVTAIGNPILGISGLINAFTSSLKILTCCCQVLRSGTLTKSALPN